MAKIDLLFQMILDTGASDLHLHEGQPPKLRVHGVVEPIANQPRLQGPQLESMMREICNDRQWQNFVNRNDMDFAYSYGEKARFRANYKRHYFGLGAVFRIIPSKIATLEELNAPPILKTFADFTSGLVLVTGPTGSGKSTTLAAAIDHMNDNFRRTVLTIEEPIEFVHKSKNCIISQREVGLDASSFQAALRGAMRQDVQVVLVGEMRDLETIRLAVTAAEMGLLVFGTLHTNSAIKTIDRIIEEFPSEEQSAVRDSLATALRAVCAQLLVRRADGKGRVAVHEVLIHNRAVSNLIREAKTNQLAALMMSGKAAGMQLMDDSIDNLLKSSVITGADAYMKAQDKERFAQYAPIN